MTFSRRGCLGVTTSLVVSGLSLSLVLNQTAADQLTPDFETVPSAATPPLPSTKSPVALFRELLAMSPEEQREHLAGRSPEQQRRLLIKLREYELLPANERELKLRATELQWYLSPLLELTPTDRKARLALIPAPQRQLVEARLEEWDKLPTAAQKELLENEATLRYFTQVEPATEEQKQAVLKSLSAARRNKLEAGVAHWQGLPLEQRQQTLARFNQFFELTPAEKDKAMVTLSDEERRQMEKTLRRFDQLSPKQRQDCLLAFSKFAALSLEERQQFLKNAEHWRFMAPDERQNWRELVQHLEVPKPPLPPGMGTPLPPMPPTPPASAVATNDRK